MALFVIPRSPRRPRNLLFNYPISSFAFLASFALNAFAFAVYCGLLRASVSPSCRFAVAFAFVVAVVACCGLWPVACRRSRRAVDNLFSRIGINYNLSFIAQINRLQVLELLPLFRYVGHKQLKTRQ